ncbi:MAG TPA: hypothetical protein VJQ54_22580, partial [Candidatus Sulfotelmatobacter sp.]|nr:hypothetical protein [Candidatus Sulfotelmatobacter sp.]
PHESQKWAARIDPQDQQVFVSCGSGFEPITVKDGFSDTFQFLGWPRRRKSQTTTGLLARDDPHQNRRRATPYVRYPRSASERERSSATA